MNSEDLFEKVRQRMGANYEQRRAKMEKFLEQLEAERKIRDTCSECGVDTGNYSHSFKCRYRGLL